MGPGRLGWFASLVAWLGAQLIYLLVRIFGRVHRRADIAWLDGPVGGATIGDATYREVCTAEGLTIERNAADGGLVPSLEVLRSATFDPSRLHPLVREFYEHTAAFSMDVWSRTYFPASVGLWLLVTTISRQVGQLEFPLSPLDTARGLESEIISMRRADGSLRYTGWFRTLARQRVLYTGFYMTEASPTLGVPCVKVVFPMPGGSATVLLRPRNDGDALVLESAGRAFGDAGFYRLQRVGADRARVWRIASLKEWFRVFVDEAGTLRCDHEVRFLGLRVLTLHYKMVAGGVTEARVAPGSAR